MNYYYQKPKPSKHHLVKLTLAFLLAGIVVIIFMTINKVSAIDTQAGGGWGIFTVIGKLFGSAVYLVWYVVMIGLLHTVSTLIGLQFIKNQNREVMLFTPVYIIIISFYMVYVYKHIYDVPKYDLTTAEGQRDSENEFMLHYKDILAEEKLQPRLPSRETLANDRKQIATEIRNVVNHYLSLGSKDTLQRDSLSKIIVRIYGVDYTGMDSTLVRTYLGRLRDSMQVELITYSSNMNYFLGLITYKFYDEQNRPEQKLYSTSLLIGNKSNGRYLLNFYSGISNSGHFFQRENARIYTLANLYRNEINVIPRYVHDSPLSSAFWNSPFFDEIVYKEKTYQRYQMDTSLTDTIHHYAPAPYLKLY